MKNMLSLRERYEDAYRKAWIKQVKKDQKDNPKAVPNRRIIKGMSLERHNKGGAPKLKLNKRAEAINKLLQKKIAQKHIADILGITRQEVFETKRRYNLPREKGEINDRR